MKIAVILLMMLIFSAQVLAEEVYGTYKFPKLEKFVIFLRGIPEVDGLTSSKMEFLKSEKIGGLKANFSFPKGRSESLLVSIILVLYDENGKVIGAKSYPFSYFRECTGLVKTKVGTEYTIGLSFDNNLEVDKFLLNYKVRPAPAHCLKQSD